MAGLLSTIRFVCAAGGNYYVLLSLIDGRCGLTALFALARGALLRLLAGLAVFRHSLVWLIWFLRIWLIHCISPASAGRALLSLSRSRQLVGMPGAGAGCPVFQQSRGAKAWWRISAKKHFCFDREVFWFIGKFAEGTVRRCPARQKTSRGNRR
jgi:hypothetical protein